MTAHKRRAWLSLLLAFVLFFGTAALAEALPLPELSQAGFTHLAADGEKLYILRADGLFVRQQAGDTPTKLCDTGEESLAYSHDAGFFVWEGQPCALLGPQGPLYRFDQDKQAFEKTAAPPRQEEEFKLYRHYFPLGDSLYAIMADPRTTVTALVQLDLEGGAPKIIKTGVRLATPYREGQMLLVLDERLDQGQFVLATLDVKSGQVNRKTALKEDWRAMRYDQQADAIYLLKPGEAQKMQGFGQAQLHCLLPLSLEVRQAALLLDGVIALPDLEGGVQLFSKHEAGKAAPGLSILGHTWELPIAEFTGEHPDIPLRLSENYPQSTGELTLHMASGDSAADIYVLYSSTYNLQALMDKGWFYDLAQDPQLFSAAQDLYPYLRQHLVQEGRVLALPFAAHITTTGFSPIAWQEVGYQEDDLPDSFLSLLALLSRYNQSTAQDFPNMAFFDPGADPRVYKMVMLDHLLMSWRSVCQQENQPVRYEPLRGLIKSLLDADFSMIGGQNPNLESFEPNQGLFSFHAEVNPGTSYWINQWPRPLKVTADSPPVIQADANLLLINPHTKNPQGALTFLRYVLDSMPQDVRMMLFPGVNEPYMVEGFLRDSALDQSLALAQEALKQAEGAQVQERQHQVDQAQRAVDDYEKMRWRVSEESLANFRALDPYFTLRLTRESPGRAPDTLRLIDGQMSLDQFIRESDQMESLRERE